jgi:hypothetical protein
MQKSGVSSFIGEARVERHASIDEERRPDYIVRGIAGQPHGGTANVFRLADAAVGNQGQQPLVRFIGIPGLAVDRRANSARRDGIDADALGGNSCARVRIIMSTPPFEAA